MSKHTNDPPEPSGGFLGAGHYIEHSIKEVVPVVIQSVMQIADRAQADALLDQLITSGFWGKYATPFEKVRIDLQATQAERSRVEARKAEILALLQTCQEFSRVAPGRGDAPEGHDELPITSWQLRDQIGAAVLFPVLILALLASLLTAHANLVGSELDVFRQNPLLPWCMASIAPMSALALKTIYSHLAHDLARRAYVFVLLLAMVVSIAIWALLFAINYHGLGTELNLGALLDAPSFWSEFRQTAFVIATLATEITVGAVLALRLSKIADRYAGDGWQANPEHARLTALWTALQAEWEALVAREGQLSGDLRAFDASLDTQINLARLSHEARRAQNTTPIL